MTSGRPTIGRGLTFLFAVAAGAAVGNLYWAQPLLGVIGATFDVSPGSAGLLVTVTQVGYAIGVFLLVPLGDTLDRRRLIPALMVLAALALEREAITLRLVAVGALIVMLVETLSRGMPANSARMSSIESIATPTLPTSPCAMGASES